MTPIWWSGDIHKYADIFYVGPYTNNIILNNGGVDAWVAIRPVISLKKEIIVTSGEGTGYNPYNIKILKSNLNR